MLAHVISSLTRGRAFLPSAHAGAEAVHGGLKKRASKTAFAHTPSRRRNRDSVCAERVHACCFVSSRGLSAALLFCQAPHQAPAMEFAFQDVEELAFSSVGAVCLHAEEELPQSPGNCQLVAASSVFALVFFADGLGA